MKEPCSVETASKLADNAFEKSTQFIYKVSTRFNRMFEIIFIWMIVVSITLLAIIFKQNE